MGAKESRIGFLSYDEAVKRDIDSIMDIWTEDVRVQLLISVSYLGISVLLVFMLVRHQTINASYESSDRN